MNYGFDPIIVGSGYGVPVPGIPLTQPDPSQEYVAGAFGRLIPRIPQLLPLSIDDVTQNFGLRVYMAMMTDPAVKSSFNSLKLGILGDEMRILPAIKVRPWQKKFTADEQAALDAVEFMTRAVERMDNPFFQTLFQLLDSMAFGNKAAEKTWEVAEDGLDKGQMTLRSVKVKPHWAWQFVVDSMLNIKGYLTFLPGGPLNPDSDSMDVVAGMLPRSGYVILPRNKFALMTWAPQDNDPRGTSILRAAYGAWNTKLQVLPYQYQHLIRFGSPGLDMEMAPGDNAYRPPVDPNTGLPITGKAPVDAASYMMSVMAAYRNNGVLVHPAGSKLSVIEPKSNGEAFMLALDWLDRQIVLAIENQVRATLEAKHGSKADSESAGDSKGLIIRYGRNTLVGMVRREIFYDTMRLRFGPEMADRFTPIPSFGEAEHQDLPARWMALSRLVSVFTFSQWAEVCADNGLPVPDPEEWQAMQAQKQAQADAIAGKKTEPVDAETGKKEEGQKQSEGELDDDRDEESMKEGPNIDNEDNADERKLGGKSETRRNGRVAPVRMFQ